MFWVTENIDALIVLTCLPVYVNLCFARTCKVLLVRGSHRRCFVKKGVLKNFIKFRPRNLNLRPATLLKKRLWRRCSPVNFAKFL